MNSGQAKNECVSMLIRLNEGKLKQQVIQEQQQKEAKAQVNERGESKEEPHRLKQEEEETRKRDLKEKELQLDREVRGRNNFSHWLPYFYQVI